MRIAARDARHLDAIKETTVLFVDVMAAQEELALSQDALQTAVNIYKTVSHRVTAGKDSPVEEAKARAELALAKLTVERARSRLAVARKTLCAMWSENVPAFASVRGDLAQVAQNVPGLTLLNEAMIGSPEWIRWTDEIRSAEWEVQSERRSRIPNLSIGVGVRQSQADDSQSFVATMGVELPIFNRQRGGILAAQAELERKRAEQEAEQTALSTELAAAHEILTTTQQAAVMIAQDALPAAEQAFAAAQASYASGKIGYLDIQDARRTLIGTRLQQIETLAEYHRAVAQVERLTGVGMGEIKRK